MGVIGSYSMIEKLIRKLMIYFGAVVDRFPELLAQRGDAHNPGKRLALACLPWSIHLWPGGGHSRNRTFGEVNVPSNKQKCVETLYRVDGCKWRGSGTGPAQRNCDTGCCLPQVPNSTK